MSDTEWFAEWFDSPYYHILYRHRDDIEARQFLDRLVNATPLIKGKRVLDIACGQGRHSRYLSDLGFDVTGFDLSPASIRNLSTVETDSLHFFVHDMRNYFRVNYFDYALNLFSSFGYFEREEDDQKVLRSAAANLKADGILVFDYANGLLLLKQQGVQESKEIDGIIFDTAKSIEGKHLVKKIHINDRGKESHFQERLRLFTPDELNTLFEKSGFRIVNKYGDYDLSAFDPEKSPRWIVVAEKK